MNTSAMHSSTAPGANAAAASPRWAYWQLVLLSIVGWTLLAAIPTTSAYIGTGAQDPAIWWAMFTKIGLYYYIWGLLTPLLYRLTDALPYRGKGLVLTVPTHIGVFAALSFGLGLVVHQPDWQQWLLGQRAFGYHSMSAFTYSLIVLCCLALKFYRLSLLRQREATDARVHAAELDNQLNLARVESLRMQMNPHFLFNALNSIGALIETDRRDKAYAALERLADLLRQALRLSQESDIPLAEELGFLEAYLALEKVRFGDRLSVDWQVAHDARPLHVPAFVLQPLVENAIKHAVGPSATTVTITVCASRTPNSLRLSVADDATVKPVALDTPGSGVGIANLRERLRLRYGNDVSVESARKPGGGYETCIEIPLPASARSR